MLDEQHGDAAGADPPDERVAVLARDSQFYQTQLVSRINSFGTKFTMNYEGLKAALISRGIDSFTAEKQATAMIYNNVRRQAGMLSYNHIFWYVGLAFLGIIPLLLLLKRPNLRRNLIVLSQDGAHNGGISFELGQDFLV